MTRFNEVLLEEGVGERWRRRAWQRRVCVPYTLGEESMCKYRVAFERANAPSHFEGIKSRTQIVPSRRPTDQMLQIEHSIQCKPLLEDARHLKGTCKAQNREQNVILQLTRSSLITSRSHVFPPNTNPVLGSGTRTSDCATLSSSLPLGKGTEFGC